MITGHDDRHFSIMVINPVYVNLEIMNHIKSMNDIAAAA